MLTLIQKRNGCIHSNMSELKTSVSFILSLLLAGCAPQSVQRVAGTLAVDATATAVPATVPTSTASVTPSATHTVTATSTLTPVPPTASELPSSTPTAIVMATGTATDIPVPTNDPPTIVPTPWPTPWPTPDSQASERVVYAPILMYHYVEPLPEDADELRVGLTVQPGIFRQQLAYLYARGYRSVSLYDLLYHLAHGKALPEKPIVFTFDDGYRGLYKHAFPHMQAFGYAGTVFLVTGLMDERQPAYLTWEMAREMAMAGWKLEPHSKTHVQLSDRPFELVEYQVLGSMQTVQAHIGDQPRFFGYPSGRYDQQVIDYLLALGFWGAVTTEYGVEHDLAGAFTWQRVRVPGQASLSDLAKYLGEDSSH